MSPTQPPPPKKDVALALLERSSVHVHLDPRPISVVVPVVFKTQPQLVLQVGLNMRVPIPDLRLDEDGMSCTLSFNRSPFFCVVPWASVFAMVGDDGRAVVWPDDIPSEVARQVQPVRVGEASTPTDAARSTAAAEPNVAMSPEATDSRDLAERPKPKRPRKRPALAAVSDPKVPAVATKPARSTPDRAPRGGNSNAQRSPATPLPGPRPSADGSRKKKKELPPYLRVVK